jgi:hypothetical protein
VSKYRHVIFAYTGFLVVLVFASLTLPPFWPLIVTLPLGIAVSRWGSREVRRIKAAEADG